MGNSCCCNTCKKPEQIIIKSELNVDINDNEIINEKDINNNLYSNKINLKNDYVNKSTIGISPTCAKDEYLFNPLPNIVTLRRKKNNN